QARLQDGATTPSLRAEGLEGIDRCYPLLDYLGGCRAIRNFDAEVALESQPNAATCDRFPLMIRATSFAGKTVAVFGLGASGTAAAHALIAGGAAVAAWDDSVAGREAAARDGLPLVDLATADWADFSALILAPGVPL